eukprot:360908-Chlamydomonas_euryale.AAC.10
MYPTATQLILGLPSSGSRPVQVVFKSVSLLPSSAKCVPATCVDKGKARLVGLHFPTTGQNARHNTAAVMLFAQLFRSIRMQNYQRVVSFSAHAYAHL